MLDLLIVKTDKDYVTKYAHEIIDKCKTLLPAIQISKRSLADTAGEKQSLSCKKLLFLLGDERRGLAENVAMWTAAVFPRTKAVLENVLVVYESMNIKEVNFYASESQIILSLKTKVITKLKDVFEWWPHVLDFIYCRKPIGLKVFLKTDVEMKEQDAETESLDVEQSKLRQDLSNLLQFNMAKQTDKYDDLMRCKMVIVVFGRNTSISDSMSSSLRLAKINGANVVFFFPHERTFDREIKRISTNRYTVSQHLEGILYVVRNTAVKKYKLPRVPKPLMPTGPLTIVVNENSPKIGYSTITAKWSPYPYGLGETISIQRLSELGNGNLAWTEIARDVPTTYHTTSIPVEEQQSYLDPTIPSMGGYRIMSEDKDGNLSRGIGSSLIDYGPGRRLETLRAVYKPDKNPVHVQCAFCAIEVDTVPMKKISKCAILSRILCCGLCTPASCIPGRIVVHTCPNCWKEVRRYVL